MPSTRHDVSASAAEVLDLRRHSADSQLQWAAENSKLLHLYGPRDGMLLPPVTGLPPFSSQAAVERAMKDGELEALREAACRGSVPPLFSDPAALFRSPGMEFAGLHDGALHPAFYHGFFPTHPAFRSTAPFLPYMPPHPDALMFSHLAGHAESHHRASKDEGRERERHRSGDRDSDRKKKRDKSQESKNSRKEERWKSNGIPVAVCEKLSSKSEHRDRDSSQECQNRDSHNRDSYSRDSHSRDSSFTRESHSRDSFSRDCHSRDSHSSSHSSSHSRDSIRELVNDHRSPPPPLHKVSHTGTIGLSDHQRTNCVASDSPDLELGERGVRDLPHRNESVSPPDTMSAYKQGQSMSPTEVTTPYKTNRSMSPPETIKAYKAGQSTSPTEVLNTYKSVSLTEVNSYASGRSMSPTDTPLYKPGRSRSPMEGVQPYKPGRSRSPMESVPPYKPGRSRSPIEDVPPYKPSRSRSPMEGVPTYKPGRSISPKESIPPYTPGQSRSPTEGMSLYKPGRSSSPTESGPPYKPVQSRSPTDGAPPYKPGRSRSPTEGALSYKLGRNVSSPDIIKPYKPGKTVPATHNDQGMEHTTPLDTMGAYKPGRMLPLHNALNSVVVRKNSNHDVASILDKSESCGHSMGPAGDPDTSHTGHDTSLLPNSRPNSRPNSSDSSDSVLSHTSEGQVPSTSSVFASTGAVAHGHMESLYSKTVTSSDSGVHVGLTTGNPSLAEIVSTSETPSVPPPLVSTIVDQLNKSTAEVTSTAASTSTPTVTMGKFRFTASPLRGKESPVYRVLGSPQRSAEQRSKYSYWPMTKKQRILGKAPSFYQAQINLEVPIRRADDPSSPERHTKKARLLQRTKPAISIFKSASRDLPFFQHYARNIVKSSKVKRSSALAVAPEYLPLSMRKPKVMRPKMSRRYMYPTRIYSLRSASKKEEDDIKALNMDDDDDDELEEGSGQESAKSVVDVDVTKESEGNASELTAKAEDKKIRVRRDRKSTGRPVGRPPKVNKKKVPGLMLGGQESTTKSEADDNSSGTDSSKSPVATVRPGSALLAALNGPPKPRKFALQMDTSPPPVSNSQSASSLLTSLASLAQTQHPNLHNTPLSKVNAEASTTEEKSDKTPSTESQASGEGADSAVVPSGIKLKAMQPKVMLTKLSKTVVSQAKKRGSGPETESKLDRLLALKQHKMFSMDHIMSSNLGVNSNDTNHTSLLDPVTGQITQKSNRDLPTIQPAEKKSITPTLVSTKRPFTKGLSSINKLSEMLMSRQSSKEIVEEGKKEPALPSMSAPVPSSPPPNLNSFPQTSASDSESPRGDRKARRKGIARRLVKRSLDDTDASNDGFTDTQGGTDGEVLSQDSSPSQNVDLTKYEKQTSSLDEVSTVQSSSLPGYTGPKVENLNNKVVDTSAKSPRTETEPLKTDKSEREGDKPSHSEHSQISSGNLQAIVIQEKLGVKSESEAEVKVSDTAVENRRKRKGLVKNKKDRLLLKDYDNKKDRLLSKDNDNKKDSLLSKDNDKKDSLLSKDNNKKDSLLSKNNDNKKDKISKDIEVKKDRVSPKELSDKKDKYVPKLALKELVEKKDKPVAKETEKLESVKPVVSKSSMVDSQILSGIPMAESRSMSRTLAGLLQGSAKEKPSEETSQRRRRQPPQVKVTDKDHIKLVKDTSPSVQDSNKEACELISNKFNKKKKARRRHVNLSNDKPPSLHSLEIQNSDSDMSDDVPLVTIKKKLTEDHLEPPKLEPVVHQPPQLEKQISVDSSLPTHTPSEEPPTNKHSKNNKKSRNKRKRGELDENIPKLDRIDEDSIKPVSEVLLKGSTVSKTLPEEEIPEKAETGDKVLAVKKTKAVINRVKRQKPNTQKKYSGVEISAKSAATKEVEEDIPPARVTRHRSSHVEPEKVQPVENRIHSRGRKSSRERRQRSAGHSYQEKAPSTSEPLVGSSFDELSPVRGKRGRHCVQVPSTDHDVTTEAISDNCSPQNRDDRSPARYSTRNSSPGNSKDVAIKELRVVLKKLHGEQSDKTEGKVESPATSPRPRLRSRDSSSLSPSPKGRLRLLDVPTSPKARLRSGELASLGSTKSPVHVIERRSERRTRSYSYKSPGRDDVRFMESETVHQDVTTIQHASPQTDDPVFVSSPSPIAMVKEKPKFEFEEEGDSEDDSSSDISTGEMPGLEEQLALYSQARLALQKPKKKEFSKRKNSQLLGLQDDHLASPAGITCPPSPASVTDEAPERVMPKRHARPPPRLQYTDRGETKESKAMGAYKRFRFDRSSSDEEDDEAEPPHRSMYAEVDSDEDIEKPASQKVPHVDQHWQTQTTRYEVVTVETRTVVQVEHTTSIAPLKLKLKLGNKLAENTTENKGVRTVKEVHKVVHKEGYPGARVRHYSEGEIGPPDMPSQQGSRSPGASTTTTTTTTEHYSIYHSKGNSLGKQPATIHSTDYESKLQAPDKPSVKLSLKKIRGGWKSHKLATPVKPPRKDAVYDFDDDEEDVGMSKAVLSFADRLKQSSAKRQMPILANEDTSVVAERLGYTKVVQATDDAQVIAEKREYSKVQQTEFSVDVDGVPGKVRRVADKKALKPKRRRSKKPKSAKGLAPPVLEQEMPQVAPVLPTTPAPLPMSPTGVSTRSNREQMPQRTAGMSPRAALENQVVSPHMTTDQGMSPRLHRDHEAVSPRTPREQVVLSPRTLREPNFMSPRSQPGVSPRALWEQTVMSPKDYREQVGFSPKAISDQTGLSPRVQAMSGKEMGSKPRRMSREYARLLREQQQQQYGQSPPDIMPAHMSADTMSGPASNVDPALSLEFSDISPAVSQGRSPALSQGRSPALSQGRSPALSQGRSPALSQGRTSRHTSIHSPQTPLHSPLPSPAPPILQPATPSMPHLQSPPPHIPGQPHQMVPQLQSPHPPPQWLSQMQNMPPHLQLQSPATPQMHSPSSVAHHASIPPPHLHSPDLQSPLPNLHSPAPQLQSPLSQLQSPQLQSPLSQLQSPPPQLQSSISQLQSSISQLQSPPQLQSSISQLQSPPPQLQSPLSQLQSPPQLRSLRSRSPAAHMQQRSPGSQLHRSPGSQLQSPMSQLQSPPLPPQLQMEQWQNAVSQPPQQPQTELDADGELPELPLTDTLDTLRKLEMLYKPARTRHQMAQQQNNSEDEVRRLRIPSSKFMPQPAQPDVIPEYDVPEFSSSESGSGSDNEGEEASRGEEESTESTTKEASHDTTSPESGVDTKTPGSGTDDKPPSSVEEAKPSPPQPASARKHRRRSSHARTCEMPIRFPELPCEEDCQCCQNESLPDLLRKLEESVDIHAPAPEDLAFLNDVDLFSCDSGKGHTPSSIQSSSEHNDNPTSVPETTSHFLHAESEVNSPIDVNSFLSSVLSDQSAVPTPPEMLPSCSGVPPTLEHQYRSMLGSEMGGQLADVAGQVVEQYGAQISDPLQVAMQQMGMPVLQPEVANGQLTSPQIQPPSLQASAHQMAQQQNTGPPPLMPVLPQFNLTDLASAEMQFMAPSFIENKDSEKAQETAKPKKKSKKKKKKQQQDETKQQEQENSSVTDIPNSLDLLFSPTGENKMDQLLTAVQDGSDPDEFGRNPFGTTPAWNSGGARSVRVSNPTLWEPTTPSKTKPTQRLSFEELETAHHVGGAVGMNTSWMSSSMGMYTCICGEIFTDNWAYQQHEAFCTGVL